MPNNPSYPVLLDKCLQLDIGTLSRSNFIQHNYIKTGSVKWSNNEASNSIAFQVNCRNNPFIILLYSSNDRNHNYKIELTSIPSNLDKGNIWYFICPIAKRKCRKLYLVNGVFCHREAYKNCMYSSQTKAKTTRSGIYKILDDFNKASELIEKAEKKYFKETYAGSMTKKAKAIYKAFDKLNLDPYY